MGWFAVPDHKTNDDPARCLTFALLWFDRLRQSSAGKNIAGVRILLPNNAAVPVAHLLAALHPQLRVQLFERDCLMERLVRIEPSAAANFSSWIVPARGAQLLQDRAGKELNALNFLLRVTSFLIDS